VKVSGKKRDFKKEVGIHMAQMSREKGLSQSQLANDAEIDLSTLSRMERGQLNFTIDTVIKIAKVLDVAPSELLRV